MIPFDLVIASWWVSGGCAVVFGSRTSSLGASQILFPHPIKKNAQHINLPTTQARISRFIWFFLNPRFQFLWDVKGNPFFQTPFFFILACPVKKKEDILNLWKKLYLSINTSWTLNAMKMQSVVFQIGDIINWRKKRMLTKTSNNNNEYFVIVEGLHTKMSPRSLPFCRDLLTWKPCQS